MPAEFLTPEQARRYGRYNGDPAPAQLAKYFFLDDNDRAEIASHRGTHNRLGYAIQLCTVRFLGTFLPEPTDIPSIVVKHLAEQLEIPDANCLGQYRERLATHHTHACEIRERHGYRDFAEQPETLASGALALYAGLAERRASHRAVRLGDGADDGT